MNRLSLAFYMAVVFVLGVLAFPPIGIAWTMLGLMIYGLLSFMIPALFSPLVVLIGLTIIAILLVYSVILIFVLKPIHSKFFTAKASS